MLMIKLKKKKLWYSLIVKYIFKVMDLGDEVLLILVRI